MNHNLHNCACARHTAIKLENLSVELNGVKILRNISLNIPRGVCTAIVGPNGAGKSTLAKAIMGFLPHTGSITFGSSDGSFSTKPPRWGYVPQKLQFDRQMPLTVTEFLAASLSFRPLFLGINGQLRQKINNMLAAMECNHLADRQLGKLSGGELQRVMLSLALLQKPEIVVLDEPAAGVDFQGEKLCCGILEKYRNAEKFTQLMISHDLATVAAHAAHVICINHRLIAAGHPSEVLTAEVLRRAFGQHAILPALPDHKELCPCQNH